MAACGTKKAEPPAIEEAPHNSDIPEAVPANEDKEGDQAAKPVGPKVETKTYVAQLSAAPLRGSSAIAAGGSADLLVEIRPQNGWHMNHEFPTSVTVAPSDAIRVEKAKFEKKDAKRFDDEGADFMMPIKLSQPGKHEAKAHLSFAVCTEQTCLPENLELALTLDVSGTGSAP